MLAWIREKFGTAMIGGIIGFIAFVFVFYGVFSPKATRGLHEGSVAGTVNGESISISEFNREYSQTVEFYKNLSGGKLTEEQIKAFKIRDTVFKQIAGRKLRTQEAKRLGFVAAESQVREEIMKMPVFQKEGKFDLATYRGILEANHYTPAAFERLMSDDVTTRQLPDFFKRRVRVSDQELRQEFEVRENQRNLKYVLIDPNSSKSGFKVEESDLKKFLADPTRMNLAKQRYEQGKTSIYKGQTLEAVQEGIARDLILSERSAENQKKAEELADQVVGKLALDSKSDASLNQLLKSSSSQVKTSGWVSLDNDFIPGVGQAKEVLADAFKAQSPIDPSQGGKAKKYHLAGRILVALVSESKKPKVDAFESQKGKLMAEVSNRKVSSLFDAWMKDLTNRGKVESNSAVIGAE